MCRYEEWGEEEEKEKGEFCRGRDGAVREQRRVSPEKSEIKIGGWKKKNPTNESSFVT